MTLAIFLLDGKLEEKNLIKQKKKGEEEERKCIKRGEKTKRALQSAR